MSVLREPACRQPLRPGRVRGTAAFRVVHVSLLASVTSRQGLHPKPSPEVGGPRGWRALLPPCGAGSSLSFPPAVPAKLTQKSQSLRSPAPQILGVRCLSLSDFCSGSRFLEDDHLQLTCGARVERTTFLPTPLRDCGFDSVLMGGSRVHFPQRVSH